MVSVGPERGETIICSHAGCRENGSASHRHYHGCNGRWAKTRALPTHSKANESGSAGRS